MYLRHTSFSRRAFLAAAGASTLAACGHKRAPRYSAWLFMASAAEKAVVVSDLASFRRSGVIPLGATPDQVLSANGKLFAVCNNHQTIAAIDPLRRIVTDTVSLPGKIAAAALTGTGDYLAVAIAQPPSIILIDTRGAKIVRHTALPGAPHAVAAAGKQAAVIVESAGGRGNREPDTLVRLSVPDGTLLGSSAVNAGALSALSYRKDSETVFVAAPGARQIISLSADTGSVLARLPVPIRPARFCVDGTGGQVFVTAGDRESQLVIFSPYQNQIDQTLYAGRALFGMAVAPVRNLLFLSNPEAGDVSIVDIDTRHVIASIRTGGNPREVLIAPSAGPEEYAFAVDANTGDVTVIHIPIVLHKSGDAFIAEPPKPIFAVFPGGAQPQSAVIVPYAV